MMLSARALAQCTPRRNKSIPLGVLPLIGGERQRESTSACIKGGDLGLEEKYERSKDQGGTWPSWPYAHQEVPHFKNSKCERQGPVCIWSVGDTAGKPESSWRYGGGGAKRAQRGKTHGTRKGHIR